MNTRVNIGMFVLDDDLEMHPTMKTVLAKAGFTVEITHDKEDFKQKLNSFDVNICGIDHLLGGLTTGLQIVKEIKSMNKWSFIIVMSGQGKKGVVEEYMNAGANKYIDKNWSDEKIKEVLSEYGVKEENPNYIDVFVQFIKVGMEEAKERVMYLKFLKRLNSN